MTGFISSIGKDVLDRSYITLGSGKEYELISVQCYIAKDHMDAAAKLKKGDQVTIIGTCKGSTLNVMLEDCTIK